MISKQEYVDNRLDIYRNDYSFYMETGTWHQTKGTDIIDNYITDLMKKATDECNGNEEKMDIMIGEVMHIATVMLEMIYAEEIKRQERISIMMRFFNASIESKRKMWTDTVAYIKKEFSVEEINISKYAENFSKHNVDAVFHAMKEDWQNTIEKQYNQKSQEIIESCDTQRMQLKLAGNVDCERRNKLKNTFFKYPQLKSIVDVIGRDKESNETTDNTVATHGERRSKHLKASAKAEATSIGNDVRYMLPNETAIMSDGQTEMLFYQRYASSQLQVYASHPIDERKKKTDKIIQSPRMNRGPIIVSIDTSGSMRGTPERIANSILLQILNMAKKQRRPCLLLTFSVRANEIDLGLPRNWHKVDDFLSHTYTGGTDGEEMMHLALKALGKRIYEMADILIISDFNMSPLTTETLKQIDIERQKGTCFYGLCIGNVRAFDNLLDKMWHIR